MNGTSYAFFSLLFISNAAYICSVSFLWDYSPIYCYVSSFLFLSFLRKVSEHSVANQYRVLLGMQMFVLGPN